MRLASESVPAVGAAYITVQFGKSEQTLSFLDSLQACRRIPNGVYVVDNGSKEVDREQIRNRLQQSPAGWKLVELPENQGYAAGCNAGMVAARRDGFDWFCLLNNDVELEADFPEVLEGLIHRYPGHALTGNVLDALTGEPTWAVGRFDPDTLAVIHENRLGRDRDGTVDFASGCLLVLPQSCLERHGPLTEDYFMYHEDSDYCLRLRRSGETIVYATGLRLRHRLSTTVGRGSSSSLYYITRNTIRLVLRHGTFWQKVRLINTLLRMTSEYLYRPRARAVVPAALRDGLLGRMGRRR